MRRILVPVERQCSFVGRGKMGKQTTLGFSAESKLQEALNAAVVGHQGCVNAIAWNAKGSLLISGSDDTRLREILLRIGYDGRHANRVDEETGWMYDILFRYFRSVVKTFVSL
ncbi:uncharacterized protein LOC122010454 [Zingiber officinale]|uniref:uncharacterized protein LOC122010454 n=1 Tax=Zingiber officinale TaxID=94328 RepID=UPI001C4D2BD3|nr:uncharacterized protein LOC122010454 [Zingiber officinale]